MKMAPGLFWGLLLILIGLSIILRVLFGVKFFGAVIALFLIFVGISMLIGKPWMFRSGKRDSDTIFEDRTIREMPGDETEYNVIFGRTVYDFTDQDFPDDKSVRIKVNTVFGSTTIKVDRNKPVMVRSDAVFGSSTMPDGNTVAFGSVNYSTDSFSTEKNHLLIEAPVVFGALHVKTE
ncbi:MAG: hypothetical protein JXA61_05650 [Bacteroidales bacterium]|nr:hypothetical protein [Bacteroidales bacterium]